MGIRWCGVARRDERSVPGWRLARGGRDWTPGFIVYLPGRGCRRLNPVSGMLRFVQSRRSVFRRFVVLGFGLVELLAFWQIAAYCADLIVLLFQKRKIGIEIMRFRLGMASQVAV